MALFREILFLIVAIFPLLVDGQADGNPHHWDRKRRCDHVDYDPPCGVCEGVGGIPSGDDNKDIELTSCIPISNASGVDPKSLIKPVWANQWTADPYYEILIGKKSDPFCFNSFPGADSVGKLCYRKDHGRQVYDMEKARALRLDVAVESVVGTIQSTIVHQNENMWIINKFPWYAAGIHQCICTNPREAGDPSKPPVFPVQYNWTDQMFYIGREKIGIEYVEENKTRILDHWAWGPHHVWSEPLTGKTIRMWQPFNGLQVFPQGTNLGPVDESLFDDIPPKMCKKGGATFRIKCDDNGMPVPPKKKSTGAPATAAAAAAAVAAGTGTAAAAADVKRAVTKVPRGHYKGKDFADMSRVLNGWLRNSPVIARTRECSEWSAKEIQQLQAMLYLARDGSLDDIYEAAQDNRRMRSKIDDLQHTWADLNAFVHDAGPGNGTDPESLSTRAGPIVSEVGRATMHDVLRDGHCHEAVMWYVHHLTEDVKALLAKMNVEVPLLSYAEHKTCPPKHLVATQDDRTAAAVSGDADKYAAVCAAYQEKVTCASCHANVHP